MDKYQKETLMKNTLILATILEVAKRATLDLPTTRRLDDNGVPYTGERTGRQAFITLNAKLREVV